MVATGYLARLWECVGREPLVDNLWSLSGDAMERLGGRVLAPTGMTRSDRA